MADDQPTERYCPAWGPGSPVCPRSICDCFIDEFPDDMVAAGALHPEFFTVVGMADCPHGPHRGPQGPNEDIAQCPVCWARTWSKRPAGEEYGGHIADCSLPRDHESFCQPGGAGHPAPEVVRGYWPQREVPDGGLPF